MEHERDSISKLAATQNIIRNKFKKTYSERLVHERNVIRAMKPLTATVAPLSTSSKVPGSKHAFKINSLRAININDLCTRMKKLVNSTNKNSDACNEDIKTIITKLREHEIIV